MCRACVDDHAAALVCTERLTDYLRRAYLFRDLSDEQLADVLARLQSKRLEDGRWLYRQGEEADRFFVVREGQIALFRQSAEGRESIIAIVGEDEVFGEELVFLDQARHDLNARAVGDCTLLAIDRLAFRSFLTGSAPLAMRLLGTLHRRQRMLLDHIERLTLQDATQRLMAYLLSQVGEEKGPQRLELSLPKSTLAAHLSIQPETLSRTLARLKDCDYLREDREVLIVDTEALRSGLSCSLCEQRWGCPGPDQRLKSLFEPAGAPAAELIVQ
jgi:CRP-like cAMP-binding protein